MTRSILRMLITAAVTLSLALGVFSGFGISLAYAANLPAAAAGYSPVAAQPVGVNFCYPSGYNRQGWRCGWRLAMAPYNLGSYYNNYYGNYYGGYYNGYYNGYYGYGYGYGYGNSGYGGRGNTGGVVDYGGQPRFGPYYGYYGCSYYYSPYCY